MTGVSRGMLTWRTNSDERYIAAGTPTKLYAMSEGGVLKDITPTTFTSGITDATLKTGYGYGTYGSSAYGVARPDLGAIIPATTWSMDKAEREEQDTLVATYARSLGEPVPDDDDETTSSSD
jgi:hypothetical protein